MRTRSRDAQKAAIVAAAAGLVGLISLFNSLGRIFWAVASDYLGRKTTYFVFFMLGMVLYALLPTWGHLGLAGLFVASVCIILTMYGGGFATVPAYLADIFGTQMVGAIHGRLITAWSVAGVVGPGAHRQAARGAARQRRGEEPRLRPHALHHGRAAVRRIHLQPAYPPGDPKHYMSEEQLARERSLQQRGRAGGDRATAAPGGSSRRLRRGSRGSRWGSRS